MRNLEERTWRAVEAWFHRDAFTGPEDVPSEYEHCTNDDCEFVRGLMRPLLEVAEGLAVDQPWSLSYEGLDDDCLFCGAYLEVGVHEPDCVWMSARELLGLSTEGHARGDKG